jgi:hypothetical protein
MEFINIVSCVRGFLSRSDSSDNLNEIKMILNNLDVLGYKPATTELQKCSDSVNPEPELEAAIFHLQAECTRITHDAERRRFYGLLSPTYGVQSSGYKRATELSLLIALCYSLLESDRVKEYLRHSKTHFSKYAEAEARRLHNEEQKIMLLAGYVPVMWDFPTYYSTARDKIDHERIRFEQLLDDWDRQSKDWAQLQDLDPSPPVKGRSRQ